jgi:hypothetical protein
MATLVLVLAVGFLASSCEILKYTGGGTIPSANYDSGKKANFGFNIDACNADPWSGEGLMSSLTFHDKWATEFGGDDPVQIKNGVMLRGWVVDLEGCDHFSSSYACDTCNGKFERVRIPGCTPWWSKSCKTKVFIPGPVQEACLATNTETNFHFDVAAKIAYDSQNPKAPGEGYAIICLADNGEGANHHADIAAAYIDTGPFYGYVNCGEVSGNIQEHSCDDE